MVKTPGTHTVGMEPTAGSFPRRPQVTPGANRAKTQEATNVSPACPSPTSSTKSFRKSQRQCRAGGRRELAGLGRGHHSGPWGRTGPFPSNRNPWHLGLPQGSVLSPEAEGGRSKAEAPGSCPGPCLSPTQRGRIRGRGQRRHGLLPAQLVSGLRTETSPHRGTQPGPSETGPDPEDSSARGQSSLPVQSLKVHWTERYSHCGGACVQGLHSQRAMEGS